MIREISGDDPGREWGKMSDVPADGRRDLRMSDGTYIILVVAIGVYAWIWIRTWA